MSENRSQGTPGFGEILGMILQNLIVAIVTLWLAQKICGATIIVSPRFLPADIDPEQAQQLTFWMMLPGAALGYSYLRIWLIQQGRARGVAWGSAFLYGVLIAFANVPLAGFIIGSLMESPILGLLLALVSLLMIPATALTMIVYGLVMGGYNAGRAQRYLDRSIGT